MNEEGAIKSLGAACDRPGGEVGQGIRLQAKQRSEIHRQSERTSGV